MLFYTTAFSPALLRKWLYRVNKLSVVAEGSWDYIYETNRYEGSFAADGELDIEAITSEQEALEALEQRWGVGWEGGTLRAPVGSGVWTIKDYEGTVIFSDSFEVHFWCGFFNSTEYGGTMWHTSDGETIAKHFAAGLYTYGGGRPIFTLAQTIDSGAAGGTMTFDGVEIPLGSEHVTLTATVAPVGFWPYGGTYDPATGLPA